MHTFWNSCYQNIEPSKLGWFEATPQPSLALIQKYAKSKHDHILDVGSGSSTLIDHLVLDGFDQVTATDISNEGLAVTKTRLAANASRVRFICDDILQPTQLNQLKKVDIWHDRAVLHFFTQESHREAYLNLLQKILASKGIVIISTFAVGGLVKCSGLDIRQYDEKLLSELLGEEFKLLESFSHTYITTWGQERPFFYAVFINSATQLV